MRRPFPLVSNGRKDAQGGVLGHLRDALLRRLGRLSGAASAQPAVAQDNNRCVDAAVLSFPIRGEALLVNLAATLRVRVPQGEQGHDPFLMTMSRSPRPRLSIDRDAYVEFRDEDATFHLKIDAVPASRLTLETPEFTMLVKFVLQYVCERYGDLEPVGEAP